MPSWRTLIRQGLDAPGTRGSNARRIAEGVTTVGGAPIGALGTKGSWMARLAAAAGRTGGTGSWSRRLAQGAEVRPGSWDEQLYASGALDDAAAAIPGDTAFEPIEGTHYPAGATVDVFHVNTAEYTAATRADGRASFSVLKDVTGTKDLIPGSGANQAPRLVDITVRDQDDPATVRGTWKALRFDGSQFAMLKAGATDNRKVAVFVVGKLNVGKSNQTHGVLANGYPTAEGGAGPVNSEILAVNTTADTDVRQRSLRIGGRYLIADGTGGDANSAHKSRIIVPESACVIWSVSRGTADTGLGGGDRFVRGGVNSDGVNGGFTTGDRAALTGTGTGWTFGGLNTSGTFGSGLKMDVYAFVVVRHTSDIAFAMAQAMAEDLQAHYDLRAIDTRLLLFGDSRINEAGLDASKAAYRVGRSMAWPEGYLPSNVSVVQFGAGGSTQQKLDDWLPSGSTPHKLFTDHRLDGGFTAGAGEWFHNDMGSAGDALYAGTAANTTDRVDAYLDLAAALYGELADTLDAVYPLIPMASASMGGLLEHARDTAALAMRSAAFVTAAKGAFPARDVNPVDVAAETSTLALYDKATLVATGGEATMALFDEPVEASDNRNGGTSGATVFYDPDGGDYVFGSGDLTHPDGLGAATKGLILGRLLRARLVA